MAVKVDKGTPKGWDYQTGRRRSRGLGRWTVRHVCLLCGGKKPLCRTCAAKAKRATSAKAKTKAERALLVNILK